MLTWRHSGPVEIFRQRRNTKGSTVRGPKVLCILLKDTVSHCRWIDNLFLRRCLFGRNIISWDFKRSDKRKSAQFENILLLQITKAKFFSFYDAFDTELERYYNIPWFDQLSGKPRDSRFGTNLSAINFRIKMQ